MSSGILTTRGCYERDTKERVEFVTIFREQFPKVDRETCVKAAGLLLRYAARHKRLAEADCNGPGDRINRTPYPLAGILIENWQAHLDLQVARLEFKIAAVCKPFKLRCELGGDPRGYTVKLFFKSAIYNTWGGCESGYGVPQ